jgi:Sec7-like guanine-nucleotide exchange factor
MKRCIWEKKLLQNTLSDLIIETNQKIQNKKNEKHKLENLKPLKSLLGSTTEVKIDFKKIKEIEKEIQNLEKELTELKEFKEKLSNSKEEPPMIWDLAFAEVFQMKKGFDIVIANPPYVRQEKIEDLNKFYSKSEYKEKLIKQIRLD